MTEQPLATATDLGSYRAADPAMLVAAAEGAVRSYCRWHIAPERSEAITVDGSGAQTQPLPTLHLTALASVSEDDVPASLDGVQWSAAGYLWRSRPWTRRLRGITATITHGYAEVPPEVQAVVLDLAVAMTDGQGGSTRRQVGQVSVQVAEERMTDLHRLVLDRYRLPGAP